MSINKIASEIGVPKMTPYKYLRHIKGEIGSYIHQNATKKTSDTLRHVILGPIRKLQIIQD